jgi:hypothetical protein
MTSLPAPMVLAGASRLHNQNDGSGIVKSFGERTADRRGSCAHSFGGIETDDPAINRLSTRETKHRVAICLVRRQVVVVAELADVGRRRGSPLATIALLPDGSAHR